MKAEFIDYFQVLQVHFLASDSVIKAAYRQLMKLNHPDNKGGNTEEVRLIQQAYETFMSETLKNEYMKEWMNHYGDPHILSGGFMKEMNESPINPLKSVVFNYMYLIQNKAYDEAFKYLSAYNRKNLFKKDFIMWQKLISEIHQIISFDCTFSGIEASPLSENAYDYVICFKVKVQEYNCLLQRTEEEIFTRKILVEQGKYRILLQTTHVKDIIRKYKKIVRLYKSNSKLMKKNNYKYDTHYKTGLVSKAIWLSNCEFELDRYHRYSNVFSVLKIELIPKTETAKAFHHKTDKIKGFLTENSRGLDSICLPKEHSFLLLLPETDALKVKAVMEKYNRYLSSMGFKGDDVNFKTGTVDHYTTSVKEFLNEIERNKE